jgi:hypothetical protein
MSFQKGTASRRGWKSGASKKDRKSLRSFRVELSVDSDDFPPLKGTRMMVCVTGGL